MHARRLLILMPVLGLAAGSAAAQVRLPDPRSYRFVSDLNGDAGLWVNPGASGFNPMVRLNGHLTLDRPRSNWKTGQYLFGLQYSLLGLGYQHDEFDELAGGYSQGDAYTLVVGAASKGNGIGVSRTWRTVGPAEGSWDIGWAFGSASGLFLGLVWQDIGSPVVRDVVLNERLVGAITVRPPKARFSASAQATYVTKLRDFREFRIGGTVGLLKTTEAVALAAWDGDGKFLGFQFGVYLASPKLWGAGVVGLDSGGDMRKASIGLSPASPRRRQ